MVGPRQANQTAARTWVATCLGCTVLTVSVLVIDLYLPEPWGGLASRQPWAVAGVMLLINVLSLFMLAGWLVHVFYARFSELARTTWHDFLYWTVGDVKEYARQPVRFQPSGPMPCRGTSYHAERY